MSIFMDTDLPGVRDGEGNGDRQGGGAEERRPLVLSAEQVRALKPYLRRVEYYQPLYGIEIEPRPLRKCDDRARVIGAELGRQGRPLRVIDWGCSLGYFVFYLSDRGHLAEGVDYLPQNVAAAQAIGRLIGLSCPFYAAELSLESVRAVPAGRFDAGLVLSVLHHVIHARGLGYAAQVVAELLERIPMLVLELAHRDEPVECPWHGSLPGDPLEVLRECRSPQLRLLGEFPTHLSEVRRPLWVVTSGADGKERATQPDQSERGAGKLL